MTLVKLNYNIYNKELLNIVTVLKEWRAFLYNTIELFIKELVLRIYKLSLLMKVKIDVLNFILSIYLA